MWHLVLLADRLKPVDEALRDPSLKVWRRELAWAVASKNVERLAPYFAPDARVGFGGQTGWPGVMEVYRPQERTSRLWRDLAKIVRLGGQFSGETFWAPYVYSAWNSDGDAYTHAAIITPNEPLRAKPSPKAPVLRRLSYDIVKVNREGQRWTQVTLAGKSGWVRNEALWSQLDTRIAIERRDGRWLITAIVEGD